PEGGPTRIGIERLEISRTSVTGELTLDDEAVAGTLTLAGGGIDGTVVLVPRGGGQGFDIALTADDATFGGATPLAIAEATIDVSGTVGGGNWTVSGSARGGGVNYGSLFLGRFAGRAEVTNGSGTFQASVTGRRSSRFALQLTGEVAPERIAVGARGDYAGRDITMPRRAVLLKTADGGWQLQQTQLGFGGGFMLAEGRFGGEEPPQGRLSLARMPLSLLDAAGADLGLGGTVSGIVDLGAGPNGVPTGEARVLVDDLTRSGLVLTSRPIDLALVARLSPSLLQARAVMKDNG